MKNLNYIKITLLIGVLFASCNKELDEAFKEAGEATPILNDFTYELTDQNYKDLNPNSSSDVYETLKAFPTFEDAIEKIPPILNQELLNTNGAKAILNINVLNDFNNKIQAFSNATEVTLVANDYPTDNAEAFLPAEDALALIPNLLTSKVNTPSEGQFVKVTYKNYTEEPVISGTAAEFDFTNETFNGWTSVNVTGVQVWNDATGFGNISMSGFDGSSRENEDWLVSPEIDLTGKTELKFQMQQNIRFGTDISLLKVLVSENYTGDINTATWNVLPFPNNQFVSNNSLANSEVVDFSAYDNKKITVAFKYNSTNSDSSRWLIGKTSIFKENATDGELTGPTEEVATYFTYTGGNWEVPSNFYTLTDEDYDAMGEDGPGRFNNFSGSALPENYLPSFLALQFPFAQEGDNQFVFYKFFSGSVQNRFDLYTFKNQQWLKPEIFSSTEIRFKFKDGAWVSDNATRYTLVEADYTAIVSALQDNEDLTDEISNLDRFGNFNRQGGTTHWDEEELLIAFNIVLKNNFPNSEAGQQFIITAAAFQGGNITLEYAVELADTGNYIYTE